MTVAPNNPKTRAFSSGRIVALVLIGLVVLGLGYLRFAPDAGSVSVPKGAHAGQLALHANTGPTRGATRPTAEHSSSPRAGQTRSRV